MKKSTKDILAEALEAVLRTKSFHKISVGDIADQCGVSRTTFYRHFQDKYECMNWVYQRQIAEIVAENKELASWQNLNMQITEFIYDKRDFFANVARYKEQNSLMECIYKCGIDYAVTQIRKELNGAPIPEKETYAIDMYIYGSVKAIEHWLNDDCKGGAELLADVLNEGVPVILSKYFVDYLNN